MTSLGFIGIGRMGAPMVRRLLGAGHQVIVTDANPAAVEEFVKAGARAAETPASLGDEAEIVFLSLPSPDIVQTVAFASNGLVHGKSLRIVVDLSTTGPRTAKTLAAGLEARGIGVVDCPVSGGMAGAASGKLSLMAAGLTRHFEAVEPYLALFGKIIHVGQEPGQAQLIKVINNLMSLTALAIASEGMVLAQKSGLDPAVLMKVVNTGSGRSNASEDKVPKYILTRSFDFGFGLSLAAKDVRLCLEEAEALGVPMIVGSAARQVLAIAKGLLGDDADLTELVKPIEQWAGVEIGAGGAPAKAD